VTGVQTCALPIFSERERKTAILLGAFVSEGWFDEARGGFDNTDREYFETVLDAFDDIVGGPRYVCERTIRSGSLLLELDIQKLAAVRESPLNALVGQNS